MSTSDNIDRERYNRSRIAGEAYIDLEVEMFARSIPDCVVESCDEDHSQEDK